MFLCLFLAGPRRVLLGSEWCCLSSALPPSPASIALLQQRSEQAPLSRSSVALSRTRPSTDPVGGGAVGGGEGGLDAVFVGKGSQRCDEFLHRVRHTQPPVLVPTNGPVLRRRRAPERLRRRKLPGEAGAALNGEGGAGAGRVTRTSARCRALSDEEVRLNARPFQPAQGRAGRTAAQSSDMRQLAGGPDRG